MASQPFFNHLHTQKTHYVFLTAETDDFDDCTIGQWQDEGFQVHYVPHGDGGGEYTRRLHAIANDVVGVSEQYAIVAYGDAASTCLEAHIKSSPRLAALVAYYPSTIPSPHTRFPQQLQVLVHICGTSIGVRKTPEVLGIQGKRRTVRKRVDPGLGLGGELEKLAFAAYTYEGVEAGFAERDLDEFDGIAEGLAWTRSLGAVRGAFGLREDVERVRDRFVVDTTKNPAKVAETLHPTAHVLYTPTLTGGFTPTDLARFYTDFFATSSTNTTTNLQTCLLSRTIGVDRVVDELHISFTHAAEIPWLLPGVPATDKKVEIIMVSIVAVKAGRLVSEHVYWDQASVLVQIGLLDPGLVPKGFKGTKGNGMPKGQGLPVVGVEAARAVVEELEPDDGVNALITGWKR